MYKVLIVDDESFVVKSLIKSINWSEYGFDVVGHAGSGSETFEPTIDLKPDVAFTDIRMPGISGLELNKKVNDTALKVLFVAISGYAEFAYAQKAMNYGVLGYCLKPFEDDEIIGVLMKAANILDANKSFPETKKMNIEMDIVHDDVKNETFRSILHYVNENYCKDISIQSISQKFFINPNYLSQLFKKEMHMTFTDYLTKMRIYYACNLLKTTRLSLTEIAEKAGYDEYHYFARVFKKMTGKTLTEFRA